MHRKLTAAISPTVAVLALMLDNGTRHNQLPSVFSAMRVSLLGWQRTVPLTKE